LQGKGEVMTTILYVEDHPPARMLMQAIIAELSDYRLLLAGSGAEARQIAEAERPDLYIVDLDLPDTDGLALAGVLKGIHAARVLLVSAYAEAVQEGSIRELVDAYLAKPLDPDSVLAAVQRALAR
jgi:CheY-like chemotaxis protein